MTYAVVWTRTARRALANDLPAPVVSAVVEFVTGPLASNPHRVGKALHGPLAGLHGARRGEYRVIYAIHDEQIVIEIIAVAHRRNAYQ